MLRLFGAFNRRSQFTFRINCPKSELDMWVGSFWTHGPPPPEKVGGGGAPFILLLIIYMMSPQTLKTFKTLQAVHYLSSYRFDLGTKTK